MITLTKESLSSIESASIDAKMGYLEIFIPILSASAFPPFSLSTKTKFGISKFLYIPLTFFVLI